jgi:hypothetical protein
VRKSFILILIISVITIFYMEGCAPSQPMAVERTIAPDRLVKRLEANRRKIKTFSGAGSILIKTSDIDAKSSFLVEIKKPDSVKISFFGPFGIDLAFALVTPQNFQFYDAINNTLYQGKMKPGVMKQILKVNVDFENLLNIVTGSVNMTKELTGDPAKAELIDDLYRLTYNDSLNQKINQYYIKTDDLEIREFQQNNKSGQNILSAKYSDFRKIEENPIPQVISLSDIQNNQNIKIEYRTIEVNKEIGKLKLDIADDAKIIQW